MKDSHNWVQKMVKEENRKLIIKLLSEKPMRFTDLLKETGYSPRGLTTMLKDLVSEKKIEKTLDEGKASYKITKKGTISYKEIASGGYAIINLVKNGGELFNTYSNQQNSMWFCALPWGIDDDIVIDKNIGEKFNPLMKDDVVKLNELIYTLISKNFNDKKIPFDETKSGTIVLSFTIDYKPLLESIKQNSLKYYKTISERELDILEKWDNGEVTREEVIEIVNLRKSKTGGRTKVVGVNNDII